MLRLCKVAFISLGRTPVRRPRDVADGRSVLRRTRVFRRARTYQLVSFRRFLVTTINFNEYRACR